MAVNWKRKKYTKEQLAQVVSESVSLRETAKKLGMNPDAGGIYYGLKAAIQDINLDTSHFLGRGWNKGDKMGLSNFNKIPLEEILVENSTYLGTTNLKKRLLKEGLLKNECYAPYCPVPNPSVHPFTGELVELKLALDHKNGDRTDNRLGNLRLLCYHCHGLTETYCAKNRTYQKEIKGNQNRYTTLCVICEQPCRSDLYWHAKCVTCLDCDKPVTKLRCKSHARIALNKTKIDWPSFDKLQEMVLQSNYSAVGRELGVSGNAVKKRLKFLDKQISTC